MYYPRHFYKNFELMIADRKQQIVAIEATIQSVRENCNHLHENGDTAFIAADPYNNREICENCGKMRYVGF